MKRTWEYATPAAAIAAAQQDSIAVGDTVRSYDFPGARNDCYVEGVVAKRDDDTLRIDVKVDARMGKVKDGSDRPVIIAPLGVSSISKWPCVYLVAKGAA